MIQLREITDIDELMRWRIEVIRNVFDVEASPELIAYNASYYLRHIPDKSHIAFVAAMDGDDIGCGGICFTDELPSPDNPTGFCGYLMNIYVRDEYRRKGIAHTIVCGLVEKALARGCGKIYLESTDGARGLYLASGFKDIRNMMKYGKTDI